MQNKNIKTICIFASSSNNIDEKYFKAAYELGVEIASNFYNIVYGGSSLGLMGETTRAAKVRGSEIIGVMPQKIYDFGVDSGECTKFILTKGMRERKAKMDELSQAIITLPGGFGTIEEISEMIVQKQLGYNNKPIVLLNTDGFYDNLINFFNDVIQKNFAQKNSKNLYHIASTPKEAVQYINDYKFIETNYLSEKLTAKMNNFAIKNQP